MSYTVMEWPFSGEDTIDIEKNCTIWYVCQILVPFVVISKTSNLLFLTI